MLFALMFGGFILLLSILLIILCYVYSKKIANLRAIYPKYSKDYSLSIMSGLASGLILTILDRGLNILIESNSNAKIFGVTFSTFLSNAFGVIISTLFGTSIMAFMILWIIYMSLPSPQKK